MRWTEKLLPRNRYERESFLKAFLLFFVVLELSFLAIFGLIYLMEKENRKYTLFLELKNYSLTFEGDKFPIDIVPRRRGFPPYELLEDEESYYILVPIPGIERELIKVYYPKERFKEDLKKVLGELALYYLGATLLSLFISFLFARYALRPLRRAFNLIEEVTKDIIHDMNTPITTLKLNLSFIKGKVNPSHYERMASAVRQLENLRDNLSPLLQESALRWEEVNLSQVVKEELESLKKLYPQVPVELSLKEVKVKGDPYGVRRIVSNILSNAFKHRKGEGPVRVELGEDYLLVENPSPPIKNPDKLFERFYRESQRGVGLGLSIVKKLSEAMGWRVEATHEKGAFRLRLRFSREGEERA
ncbi:MAG: HAMP domain-containing histidine kinase [Aquificae bacterium]|nr:HAMP domain-containing histidine kinase [Aquificota bacterium]